MSRFELPAFFSRTCTAVLSALLLTAVIACTGNGGSANSDGDIYNHGMGGVIPVTQVQHHPATSPGRSRLPQKTS